MRYSLIGGKAVVFAVVESMNFYKNGVEVHYQLVDSSVGVGWGNYEGTMWYPQDMYISKAEVLASL